ncbi:MAG TPA: tetratricopeptide repeat protein [Xanthomonadales bacterium]
MSIVKELKRRNVFRVAAAYLSGAWLLVEIVQTLFPIYGLSDASIRLVVTLLTIGFPLALLFSWLYELTPEGLRLEKDIDHSVTLTHQPAKKLDRIIIVLLTLALGYFAVDKFVLEPERVVEIAETAARTGARQALESQKELALPDKSIAVLPFANMSADPDDEYFSDGLTEELIGALAKVNGLHVTARTSAFVFKGANRDIREIGKHLNVRTVLEGSVRREKDRVRITAQLINVGDGYHLWSESYDYELESVLALQETITRAIVGALQIQLTPQVDRQFAMPATNNQKAHDHYLKGRYYWARLDTGGFQKSIEEFQKAIAADPGYAPPHAGLANAYSFSGYFGIMPPREAFPLSIMEAETALALDPESSEALVARGMAWLVYEWDWDRARDTLLLALKYSPNASLSHWAYAEYLATIDPEAALNSALHALSLDPLSLPLMNLVAFSYVTLGRYQEAIQTDEEMLAMDPNFVAAHWNLGLIHLLQGRFEEAIEELGQSVELSNAMPPTLAVLAYAFAKSGDEVQALTTLEKLESVREPPNPGYAPPLLIAYVYEGLGKNEDALHWLEQAVIERDGWLVNINVFPRFESLRDEPRFKDILLRIGLPDVNRDRP